MLSIVLSAMILMVALPLTRGQDWTRNYTSAPCNETTCCCPPAAMTIVKAESQYTIQGFSATGINCNTTAFTSFVIQKLNDETTTAAGSFTLIEENTLKLTLAQTTSPGSNCEVIMQYSATPSSGGGPAVVPAPPSQRNATLNGAVSRYQSTLHMKFFALVTTTIFIVRV